MMYELVEGQGVASNVFWAWATVCAHTANKYACFSDEQRKTATGSGNRHHCVCVCECVSAWAASVNTPVKRQSVCVLWAVELPVGSVLVSVKLAVQMGSHSPTECFHSRLFGRTHHPLSLSFSHLLQSPLTHKHTHAQVRIYFLSCEMSSCKPSRVTRFNLGVLIPGQIWPNLIVQ